ncbi:hypothetical protein [Streptomyces sp. NBC_00267]
MWAAHDVRIRPRGHQAATAPRGRPPGADLPVSGPARRSELCTA